MKKEKIFYWSATILIFLFQGVMPALTSQSEMAKQGISHLGYPAYFGVVLAVCKVTGALVILLPFIPARIKEWAYAGFTFDFLFASISNASVDGMSFNVFAPFITLAILAVSYAYYHKLRAGKQEPARQHKNDQLAYNN